MILTELCPLWSLMLLGNLSKLEIETLGRDQVKSEINSWRKLTKPNK